MSWVHALGRDALATHLPPAVSAVEDLREGALARAVLPLDDPRGLALGLGEFDPPGLVERLPPRAGLLELDKMIDGFRHEYPRIMGRDAPSAQTLLAEKCIKTKTWYHTLLNRSRGRLHIERVHRSCRSTPVIDSSTERTTAPSHHRNLDLAKTRFDLLFEIMPSLRRE